METEILVVRDYDYFSSILTEQGFSVINFPTIKTEKIIDCAELDKIISEIETFDGIFITSPNAAEPFLERFKKTWENYRGKIYVLGQRTNELFKTAGIETFSSKDTKNAAELLDSIPKNELESKKFLYLRGNRSLRIIPEMLRDFAEVKELIVYKTAATPTNEKQSDKIKEKLRNKKIAAICFFSPSGVQGFLENFAEFEQSTIKIAAIGKTTARYIEDKNLRIDFIAENPVTKDFANGLVNYLRREIE
ncbi:MAG: uroporphyrinogen-III synthase [Acidobacteria bacterium]|jgi:uroporphyrinogen-III synthase|nr:uroporphyrinogen-III synthase [Acidobacteriota bacterium]